MQQYPQSAYATGVFIGARPVKKVTDTFETMEIAIDTQSEFEADKIKVFTLTRSPQKNLFPLLSGIQPGMEIKVKYNVVCRKGSNSGWFTSLIPWQIEKYVPQTASDFSDIGAQYDKVETATHSPAPADNSGDDLPF